MTDVYIGYLDVKEEPPAPDNRNLYILIGIVILIAIIIFLI